MDKIEKSMTFEEIIAKQPKSAEIMMGYGLHCIGCHAAIWETLEQGALAHGMTESQINEMLKELNGTVC